MRKAPFLLVSAAVFAALPRAMELGALAGPLAIIALGIVLAVAASGAAEPLAVGAGALGALGYLVTQPASAALAGAVLVSAAYAERALRVRTRGGKIAHVALAMVGGAAALAVVASFATAQVAVLGIAIVVGVVLASFPLLVDADDPVAHALDRASAHLSEPARSSLRAAAELRRDAGDLPLDRAAKEQVRATWRSLLRLAESRLRLERAVLPGSTTEAVRALVDDRIEEHTRSLMRAYTAVDAAHAARVGVDDAARRTVDATTESLEQLSEALVDER